MLFRSLRAWLEMLSIADRNGGALPGDFNAYPSIVAGACESTTRHSREVCEWLTRWLRVDHEGITRVVNYGKYNKTAESYPLPPDLTRPSLTRSYKNKNEKPASPEPSAGSQIKGKRSQNLSPELKAETDRLYEFDPDKFSKLIVWVNQGRKEGFTEPDMAEALREFWGYRVIDDWYPYLDKILKKVETNGTRDAALERHEELKKEEKFWAEGVKHGDKKR